MVVGGSSMSQLVSMKCPQRIVEPFTTTGELPVPENWLGLIFGSGERCVCSERSPGYKDIGQQTGAWWTTSTSRGNDRDHKPK